MKFHREGERSSIDHTVLITVSTDVSLEFKSKDKYCLLAINILERM